MRSLFTIGHSTYEQDRFIGLLKIHGIEAIADVRSHPFSRLPWFSRPLLEKELNLHGIRYVFLGKELGARRDERECYVGARVDYDLIAKTPLFAKGLERLQVGIEKYKIALMCAEKDPLDCHRTILVSRHAQAFADIHHILSSGNLERHADAENRLILRYDPDGVSELFRSKEDLINAMYKRRGDEIAYVDQTEISAPNERL